MERCDTRKILEKINAKKTEAREKILDVILSAEVPFTANELHLMLADRSNIDLATVYRTLKKFADKNVVRTFSIEGDMVYYEKSCEHNPLHAHFFCEKCRKVECLKPYVFSEKASFMSMASDKEIKSVDLILKGRCSRCV